MKGRWFIGAILLGFFVPCEMALGEVLPAEGKAAFVRGVERLKERKGEIFNTQTMPAFESILDVRVTSKVTSGDEKKATIGYVGVVSRTTKESGHLKEFWLAYRDGKWVLTRSSRSPWSSEHPPKASIQEDLAQAIQREVQKCFAE